MWIVWNNENLKSERWAECKRPSSWEEKSEHLDRPLNCVTVVTSKSKIMLSNWRVRQRSCFQQQHLFLAKLLYIRAPAICFLHVDFLAMLWVDKDLSIFLFCSFIISPCAQLRRQSGMAYGKQITMMPENTSRKLSMLTAVEKMCLFRHLWDWEGAWHWK